MFTLHRAAYQKAPSHKEVLVKHLSAEIGRVYSNPHFQRMCHVGLKQYKSKDRVMNGKNGIFGKKREEVNEAIMQEAMREQFLFAALCKGVVRLYGNNSLKTLELICQATVDFLDGSLQRKPKNLVHKAFVAAIYCCLKRVAPRITSYPLFGLMVYRKSNNGRYQKGVVIYLDPKKAGNATVVFENGTLPQLTYETLPLTHNDELFENARLVNCLPGEKQWQPYALQPPQFLRRPGGCFYCTNH